MTDPKPVIIGQDNPYLSAIEQGLIAIGVKVAETTLAASEPWTALPIFAWLVDSGIKFAITEVVKEIDQIGYEIYVSVEDYIQVMDYVAAQKSGNQAAIDLAADNLLKLGSL